MKTALRPLGALPGVVSLLVAGFAFMRPARGILRYPAVVARPSWRRARSAGR